MLPVGFVVLLLKTEMLCKGGPDGAYFVARAFACLGTLICLTEIVGISLGALPSLFFRLVICFL